MAELVRPINPHRGRRFLSARAGRRFDTRFQLTKSSRQFFHARCTFGHADLIFEKVGGWPAARRVKIDGRGRGCAPFGSRCENVSGRRPLVVARRDRLPGAPVAMLRAQARTRTIPNGLATAWPALLNRTQLDTIYSTLKRCGAGEVPTAAIFAFPAVLARWRAAAFKRCPARNRPSGVDHWAA
jgi:hypothetical protein